MTMKNLSRVVALAAMLVVLAACAALGGPREGGSPMDLGKPGELLDQTAGVAFYPACGNEILGFEGATYYQFQPSNAEDFVPPSRADAPQGKSRGVLPRVAAPGPGDDTGTLTRYDGGFAYWVSDNGRLSTWLTTQEITYNWVC